MLLRLSGIVKPLTIIIYISGLLLSEEATVIGSVSTDIEQIPIHGANIYIEELSAGTSSKVDGSFVIDNLPYGSLHLTISMIGFKEKDISININKVVYDLGQINMIRDTIKIDGVNVSAHTEIQPKSVSSSVYIAGDRYHTNLQSSLAMTMEEEVGMAIQSMGQGATQPVLRGYSGDRFLLTEDGLTVGDLSNTSVDHTVSMDMASFNKVEVIRGPESLLYGSNTIAGVIDVSRQIDWQTRYKKSSLQAVVGSESASTSFFGNIVYHIPILNQHQLKFSILKRESGNQVSPLGPVQNTSIYNDEVTGSYTYFGSNYRGTLSFEQINMDYGIPGSPGGHISGVDLDMEKKSQKLSFHKDIMFLGFQTLDIDQRYMRYSHTESEKNIENPTVVLQQQIFSLHAILKKAGFHLGTSFQNRDFQAGGFYWTPNTKEIKAALFGLMEKELYDFLIQFSSRLEYLSVIPDMKYTPSNLDPSFMIKRDFQLISGAMSIFKDWEFWKLNLTTMVAGRSPGIEDLFSDGPHLGTYAYEIGEPQLDQEQTIGLESTLEHRTEKSSIKLTAFQNFSPNYHLSSKMGDCPEALNWSPTLGISHPCAGSDFIAWGSGPGWLYKYQIEGVRALIYGFESTLEYQLTNQINLYGSISTVRGRNVTANIPLALMPPDKFLLATEVNSGKAISMTATLKRVSDQKRLGEFETETGGYFLADLSGTYTMNKRNSLHKIILSVDNIFDTEYYNHLSRIKMIMPEKGRSFNLQYRLIF
tara:strand:- start:233 stop:2506 length:2274 start_codon:yes stop_codon:yes gene_type:complete